MDIDIKETLKEIATSNFQTALQIKLLSWSFIARSRNVIGALYGTNCSKCGQMDEDKLSNFLQRIADSV